MRFHATGPVTFEIHEALGIVLLSYREFVVHDVDVDVDISPMRLGTFPSIRHLPRACHPWPQRRRQFPRAEKRKIEVFGYRELDQRGSRAFSRRAFAFPTLRHSRQQ